MDTIALENVEPLTNVHLPERDLVAEAISASNLDCSNAYDDYDTDMVQVVHIKKKSHTIDENIQVTENVSRDVSNAKTDYYVSGTASRKTEQNINKPEQNINKTLFLIRPYSLDGKNKEIEKQQIAISINCSDGSENTGSDECSEKATSTIILEQGATDVVPCINGSDGALENASLREPGVHSNGVITDIDNAREKPDSKDWRNWYVCAVCGKYYDMPSGLKKHMATLHGPKDFLCSTCGKEFASSYSLARHEKTHATDERKYFCKVCQKSFYQKLYCDRHEERHTGSHYKHQCHRCEKFFTSSTHLKRHLPIHDGIKPHECDLCGNRFSQYNDMRRHKKIHDRE